MGTAAEGALHPMKFILASDLRCLNKESSKPCYE